MTTERIIEAACDMLEALAASFYTAAKVCGEQQDAILRSTGPTQADLYERSRALILQGMATAHREDARLIEAHIIELRHNRDDPPAAPRLVAVPSPTEGTEN